VAKYQADTYKTVQHMTTSYFLFEPTRRAFCLPT